MCTYECTLTLPPHTHSTLPIKQTPKDLKIKEELVENGRGLAGEGNGRNRVMDRVNILSTGMKISK